jgi:hypothetical protein
MLTRIQEVVQRPLSREVWMEVELSWLDQLGRPGFEDDPHDWAGGEPPGPMRGWTFETPCGLEFGIGQYWMEPLGVASLHVTHACEVEHVLSHLPFPARLIDRVGPELPAGTGWEVRRVDNSGGWFVVGRFDREASAQCVMRELESLGHKQGYVVAQLELPPEPPTPWTVERVDDNGQRFTVARHVNRFMAQNHVRLLEQEPRHKQTYWVERR